ncbi:MAG: SpoVG family protein [Clostridia bacterium]
MNLYVKINNTFDNGQNLKAFATLIIDKQFAITGIRVLNSKNGLIALMPSRKDSKGEYHDVCFPTSAELRKNISEAIIKAYEEHMKK